MRIAKLTHPVKNDEFVSWLRSVAGQHFMGLLVAYHRQELEMLQAQALRKGDTECLKGEVMGLARFLKPFDFLADTATETDDKSDTATGTAKEL